MTATVGLIAHSGAAQDVRRLTSLARTIDVHERVNVVARILAGLAAAPAVRVRYLPEPTRVVERALATLAASGSDGDRRRSPSAGAGCGRDAAGTRAAAAALADAGAALRRDARRATAPTARSPPDGPAPCIVPLPGGTNNAFARLRRPDRRRARGRRSTRRDPGRSPRALRRRRDLSIAVDGAPRRDRARRRRPRHATSGSARTRSGTPSRLVEAVVAGRRSRGAGTRRRRRHAGARRRGRPRASTCASAARGAPCSPPSGPGGWSRCACRSRARSRVGERGELRGPGTLALDGERELVLRRGESARASALAADGPRRARCRRGSSARTRARGGPPADVTHEPTTTQGGP